MLDAEPLASLAEATFRDAFGGENTAEDLGLHCAANFAPALQRREILSPAMRTLVGESDGRLEAYGQLRFGPAPEGLVAAHPVEILRFYVRRPWHGTGAARELMAALLAEARSQGADRVWLGVWERNPRAIAFYAKSGFRPVGEHEFLLGRDRQRDLILARDLGET